MFVSGLSVSEFVLLPNVRVLGIVYGSVVHNQIEIGLMDCSRVMKREGRRQSQIVSAALMRLRDNASKMGATGVIGIRIKHQPLEENIAQYTLSGTAIIDGACKHQAKPFVCTLSGQDYWLLVSNGYRPVGVAFGVSVYSQRLHQAVQQEVSRGLNAERSDFTLGLYRARKHAFEALHQEAARLNSEGVVAVDVGVEKKIHGLFGSSEGMVIKMIAMGTAVVSYSGNNNVTVDYSVPLNR